MKKFTLNLIFIGFLVLLTIWIQSFLSTIPAEHALSKANKLLNIPTSSADEIKDLIKIAESENEFRPWTFWLKGMLSEKIGRSEEAINNYSKVTLNSAAYPDALLSLVFLYINKKDYESAREKYNLAEIITNKTKRIDLNLKIELAKALLLEDTASQINSLLEYRKKYLSNIAANYLNLILKETNYKLSLAEQLEDINLLIKEKSFELAENKLTKLQSNLEDDSQAKLETLLTSQELYRRTSRISLADELLKKVSNEGKIGLGDVALKKMIIINWNDNKLDLALENFNRFTARFPDSKLVAEIYYIQGRIFEEQNKNNAAKLAYEQALKKITEDENNLKIKILRNLAWSYFKDKNYSKSAENFEKLQLLLVNKQNLDLEEYEHSTFWKQLSLKNDANSGASDKTNTEELNNLKGYYTLLAAKTFNTTPPYKLIKNSKYDLTSCGANNIDANIIEKLDKFNHPELKNFLKAEISWWSSMTKVSLTPEEDANNQILKLNLYSNYNLYKDSIEQAQRSIISISKSNIKLTKDCELALLAKSHPIAFQKEFEESAKNYDVPNTLLLAISRTESGFDPNIVSAKDAFGLMQLIKETALREGLKNEENLFDPKTNVNLGSKHIKYLLKKYNSNKAYAIAAYNAGETAVDRWIQRYPDMETDVWIEQISYPETKNYVKKVLYAESIYEELLK